MPSALRVSGSMGVCSGGDIHRRGMRRHDLAPREGRTHTPLLTVCEVTLCTPAPEVRMNHGFFTPTRVRGLDAVDEADTWSYPGVRAGAPGPSCVAGRGVPDLHGHPATGVPHGRTPAATARKVSGPPPEPEPPGAASLPEGQLP